MKNKILLLEDEQAIRSFIEIKLRSQGYVVIECETGKEALEKIDESIDIALLDVMLPDMNGFEICERFREDYPNLGIIMVTAKGQEEDKVTGLKGGADDYMVKPFSPKELTARIESLQRRLNRNKIESKKNRITNKPFTIDMDKRILTKEDQFISLTPTEYAVMAFLMNHPNKTFSRDQLLDEVWGENYAGEIKVVDVNMRRIRTKIEEDPSNPRFLKTVWGHGYIWSNE